METCAVMVFSLLRRREPDPGPALYARVVELARRPGFYETLGVPDTVEGRLELVMLHVGLVFDRLSKADDASRALAQRLTELFVTDMDRSLRELGVGDLSVPKKIQKIAQGFYGRLDAVQAGLKGGDGDLAKALARNVYGGEAPAGAPEALARYVAAAAAALAALPAGTVSAARFALPDPVVDADGSGR